MANEPTKEQMNQVLFIQLVSMFQGAAWQAMGKLKNPVTDKIERDLEQARTSIDMLAMLRTKMEGNLTDEEKRLLDQVLADLRLNYVDEINKSKTEPDKAEKDSEQGEI